MNLIKIVHSLRWAKGTNAKLEILKKHSDNEMWKKFLVYTYDESISYGVSAPKTCNFDAVEIDNSMFINLTDLANREITGNQAKYLIQLLSEQFGEIPLLILGRSIKAGVSFTTINKAYPALIEIFESMKGKDVPILEYPVQSSIKFDGVKVFTFVRPEEIKFTSSSGTEFKCSKLLKEFEGATYGVYEGELIDNEGKQIHRSVISGRLNSLLAGTLNCIGDDDSYMIYDYITLEEWDSKKGMNPFRFRQEMLESTFDMYFQDSAYVQQVEQVLLLNEEQVIDYFKLLIYHGYEGSMHRYDDDVYVWKRVDRLVKKKTIKQCILLCNETVPHSNPSKGNIGSLVCEGNIHDKDVGKVYVTVNVGSGLSKFDIQRSPEYFVGKEIEVLYNTVTISNGKYSLFLPRFKRVKGDI